MIPLISFVAQINNKENTVEHIINQCYLNMEVLGIADSPFPEKHLHIIME